MARSAMTTAPRRVTAEARSRVFASSRDLRYRATSPLSLTWGATRGARCAPRSAGTGAVSSSFQGTTPLEGACRAPAHHDDYHHDYHPTENYRPRRLGVLIPQPDRKSVV